MMKRHVCRLLACVLLVTALLGAAPATASAAFADVPAGSWAEQSINRCVQSGLFQGETATRFGMGKPMTRAAFTVVLCRFFGWELTKPAQPTYTDVQDPARWYYSAVETAYAHGAITRQTENFRPNDPITREEMAVMLVRALGYTTLAGQAQELEIPFADVTTNKGYIAMAYEMGVINGTSGTTFSPERTATREQAAVMLMRLYDKVNSSAPKLVGIAAEQTGEWNGYDAVAITGGRLSYAVNQALVTRPEQKREETLIAAIHAGGAKALLQVSGNATALKGKTNALAAALEKAMQEGGYDGLYLTFENLTANRSAALTALVKAVNALLPAGKLLYVEVESPVRSGGGSKAYAYGDLAAAADCLVLQIEPYKLWDGTLMAAPMEPMEEVYYVFSALNDSVPAEKLCLQLTTTASIWQGAKGVGNADAAELQAILETENARAYYSDRYQCAYVQQMGVNPVRVTWYLNEEAARERVQLCSLFGAERICLGGRGAVPEAILAGVTK